MDRGEAYVLKTRKRSYFLTRGQHEYTNASTIDPTAVRVGFKAIPIKTILWGQAIPNLGSNKMSFYSFFINNLTSALYSSHLGRASVPLTGRVTSVRLALTSCRLSGANQGLDADRARLSRSLSLLIVESGTALELPVLRRPARHEAGSASAFVVVVVVVVVVVLEVMDLGTKPGACQACRTEKMSNTKKTTHETELASSQPTLQHIQPTARHARITLNKVLFPWTRQNRNDCFGKDFR